MAWERHGGHEYFYLSRRQNGRVVRDYYGRGPAAELAALQVEQRKEARLAARLRRTDMQRQLAGPERAVQQLTQATSGRTTMPPDDACPKTSPLNAPMPALPPEVTTRVSELLLAREAGDPAADAELAQLVDQYSALWINFGDLGRHALEAWLELLAGTDRMFRAALSQKLGDLRRQFAVAPGDVAGQLIVDRVLATWLQVTQADYRMARAAGQNQRELDFLMRRQQHAQRQHLSAIQSWRQWRRLVAEIPARHAVDPAKAEQPSEQTANNELQILPFPRSLATA